MVIVVVELQSSWKWMFWQKLQLTCNWIAMNYNSCNSWNLFDNIHSIEIWWIKSGHCNSKIELQGQLQNNLFFIVQWNDLVVQ